MRGGRADSACAVVHVVGADLPPAASACRRLGAGRRRQGAWLGGREQPQRRCLRASQRFSPFSQQR